VHSSAHAIRRHARQDAEKGSQWAQRVACAIRQRAMRKELRHAVRADTPPVRPVCRKRTLMRNEYTRHKPATCRRAAAPINSAASKVDVDFAVCSVFVDEFEARRRPPAATTCQTVPPDVPSAEQRRAI